MLVEYELFDFSINAQVRSSSTTAETGHDGFVALMKLISLLTYSIMLYGLLAVLNAAKDVNGA